MINIGWLDMTCLVWIRAPSYRAYLIGNHTPNAIKGRAGRHVYSPIGELSIGRSWSLGTSLSVLATIA
jgi:hypothetical protein